MGGPAPGGRTRPARAGPRSVGRNETSPSFRPLLEFGLVPFPLLLGPGGVLSGLPQFFFLQGLPCPFPRLVPDRLAEPLLAGPGLADQPLTGLSGLQGGLDRLKPS